MANWALVVGINEYPDPKVTPLLKGAVADACDFAEWALHDEGGKVAPQRLYFWAHPWPTHHEEGHADFKACEEFTELPKYLAAVGSQWHHAIANFADVDRMRAPLASEIVRTAEMIGREANEQGFGQPGQERNRLFVFFAGHGLRLNERGDPTNQTCFIAHDFRPGSDSQLVEGLVPCTSLRRSLRLNRFDEVLMFADCCRSDTNLPSTYEAAPICDVKGQKDELGWTEGYATGIKGFAYETIADPFRGAFSLTVMRGLRGSGDNRRDLNVAELETYVQQNIMSATKMGQTPQFYCEPADREMIIATSKVPDANRPVVVFRGLNPGERLILRYGNNSIVPGAVISAGPGPTRLPPLADGFYSLALENDPAREVLFRVPRTEPIEAFP